MNEVIKGVLGKIIGGRYFLTVCCGIVFVYASIKGILNEATIAAIVVGVFKDYFNRERGNGNGVK